MRRFMILLVALLLPLSVLEMSADEKGTIQPIPLRKVEKKDLSRTLERESITTAYCIMFACIQTIVVEDLGEVTLHVSNLSTGEAWSDTFDSGAFMQNIMPISGTPGYYEIEYITETSDVYAGEFIIE